MKKTLALILAVMMLVAMTAVASANGYIPRQPSIANSKLLGLECPNVPSMKCKNDGWTQTVTLSEGLDYLAGVWNWQWVNVEWSDDSHTFGTLPMGGHNAQQGYGHWGNTSVAWNVLESESIGTTINADTTDEELDAPFTRIDEIGVALMEDYDPENYDDPAPRTKTRWNASAWHTEVEGKAPHVDVVTEYYEGTKENKYEDWELTFVEVDLYRNIYIHNTGAYEMGFAYDGTTKEGANVRYDSHGNAVSATVKMSGTVFFGEGATTETSVTWQQRRNANNKPVWFVAEVKETYEDGSYARSKFTQSGDCTGEIFVDANGKKYEIFSRGTALDMGIIH